MIASELRPGMVFSRKFHHITEMVTSVAHTIDGSILLSWLVISDHAYAIHEVAFHTSSIIYDMHDWNRLA